ncbi:MAG TPA: hypothetical protein VG148_11880, partial [Pyrinomonadaceae bacterium]|nr:hypothetical protein [Pyrinomonadaceae bacterium]
MKRCPTCLEEFAEKFGFCPVDGTPLNGHVPQPVAASHLADESVTVAAAAGAGAGAEGFDAGEETVAAAAVGGREEYHLTILEDVGLTRRLTKELREVAHDNELNWKEFKRSPGQFTQRAVAGYSRAGWKFFSQRNIAVAVLTAFVVITTVVVGVVLLERVRMARAEQRAAMTEQLELVEMLNTEIPNEQPEPDKGPAGMNEGKGGGSKPKYEKPQGGGGGGRQEQLPASHGKLPTAQLVPVILPPNPHPPAIKNPKLPTPVTIDLDPMLSKPDLSNSPYGDPKSTATTPSSGPGTGGGIGTGTGGGVGPGEGGGFGPGRGGNTG